MGEQNDGMLLEEMAQRHQEAEQATAEPKPLKINAIFTKVQKELEFAQFSKHLLSSLNQVQTPGQPVSEKFKGIDPKNYTTAITAPSPVFESSKMPPAGSKNLRVRRESTNNNLYGMQSARLGNTASSNVRSASTKPNTSG